MPLEAPAATPPEPEPIPIDFWDSGGEARIFEKLKPDEIGRALLNGEPVWAKQFILMGKKEVMILREGDPCQGGHWQTWEVVRENLNNQAKSATPSSYRENVVKIADGLREKLERAAARLARLENPRKRDEKTEEEQGHILGKYLKNTIDGKRRTSIELSTRKLTVYIQDGTLNVGTDDFFSVLESHLRRLGTMKQTQFLQPSSSHSVFNFYAECEDVTFNAIRALVVTLDTQQSVRSRPNVKGMLEVRAEYSTYGFRYLAFTYEF